VGDVNANKKPGPVATHKLGPGKHIWEPLCDRVLNKPERRPRLELICNPPNRGEERPVSETVPSVIRGRASLTSYMIGLQ